MCYNIGMDERFINELLDYTLPKQRAEYGGFTFPRSFIAEMFIGVLERYRARLTMQGINPALYGVYEFKQSFNGEVVTFAGEFDYPFRPFGKWLVETALNVRSTLRHLKK